MKKHLRSKCFFSYIRRAASYIAFGSEIRLSPSDIRFASFSANIISLRRRRNITFAAGRNITPGGVRYIIKIFAKKQRFFEKCAAFNV